MKKWLRYKEHTGARKACVSAQYIPFLYREDKIWPGFIVRSPPYGRENQTMLGGVLRNMARKMYAEGYWPEDKLIRESDRKDQFK